MRWSCHHQCMGWPVQSSGMGLWWASLVWSSALHASRSLPLLLPHWCTLPSVHTSGGGARRKGDIDGHKLHIQWAWCSGVVHLVTAIGSCGAKVTSALPWIRPHQSLEAELAVKRYCSGCVYVKGPPLLSSRSSIGDLVVLELRVARSADDWAWGPHRGTGFSYVHSSIGFTAAVHCPHFCATYTPA